MSSFLVLTVIFALIARNFSGIRLNTHTAALAAFSYLLLILIISKIQIKHFVENKSYKSFENEIRRS